jgi:hypothetical protein
MLQIESALHGTLEHHVSIDQRGRRDSASMLRSTSGGGAAAGAKPTTPAASLAGAPQSDRGAAMQSHAEHARVARNPPSAASTRARQSSAPASVRAASTPD